MLLLRTFINLTSTAPGFDPDGVDHHPRVDPAAFRTAMPRRSWRCRTACATPPASLPGVTAAAHAMFIPFAPGSWGDGYRRAGTADAAPRGPMAHFFMVSPEYFEVMRIPVLRGRGLSAADRAGAPPVLMVSETFAKTAFPGQDAVGRRIEWNDGTWEIVGVTGDIRHAALSDPFDADVYVPRRQVVRDNTWLLLKTDRPAAAVLAELQERVKSIDADVALTDAQTMEARLAESAAPERFRAIVTGTLAGADAPARHRRPARRRLLRGDAAHAGDWRPTRARATPVRCGACRDARHAPDRRRRRGAWGRSARVYAGRWLSSVVMVNADQTAALSGVVGNLRGRGARRRRRPRLAGEPRGSYRRVANLLDTTEALPSRLTKENWPNSQDGYRSEALRLRDHLMMPRPDRRAAAATKFSYSSSSSTNFTLGSVRPVGSLTLGDRLPALTMASAFACLAGESFRSLMTPGKPSDGWARNGNAGALGRCGIHEVANSFEIKNGIRILVAARDESLHAFRQLVARYSMVCIDIERHEPFDHRVGGILRPRRKRQRRYLGNEQCRTQQHGRLCGGSSQPASAWLRLSGRCLYCFSPRSSYSQTDSRIWDRSGISASVSVLRKAISAAFSDAVNFNGPTGIT